MAKVWQHPNGRWYMRFRITGQDGRVQQKMLSCGPSVKTEPQANRLMAEIIVQINRGTYTDPSELTVEEYFAKWRGRKEAKKLSPATLRGYDSYIQNYIIPALGAFKMRKVKPVQIQDFFDELGKELSEKTLANIYGIVNGAFSEACRLETIPRNPAENVELPAVPKPEIHVADENELALLLSSTRNSPYGIAIRICLGAGLRRGEVLALKWSDFQHGEVDGKTVGLLQVRRAVVQVKGGLHLKGTKSGRERVVTFGETLVNDLLAYKAVQEQNKAEQGKKYQPGDWICARADGSQLTPSGFDRYFYDLKQRTGIQVTIHGLRHTYATEQLAAGVPSEVVSKMLGHARFAFTHDKYSHAMPRHQLVAVDISEKLLQSKPNIRVVGE